MTTVITPGSEKGNGGWAVAVIILILVIVGIVFVYPKLNGDSNKDTGASIEVNLPSAANDNQ